MGDNFFTAALKHPIMKWIIIAAALFLFLMLLWSGCKHKRLCDEGRDSKFLWGADECISSKPFDTVLIKDSMKITEPKKVKRKNITPNVDTIVLNQKNINNGTNYGNIGDTYNSTLKQRHFIVAPFLEFTKRLPSKDFPIIICSTSNDSETMNLVWEMESKIKDMGYNISYRGVASPMRDRTLCSVNTYIDQNEAYLVVNPCINYTD